MKIEELVLDGFKACGLPCRRVSLRTQSYSVRTTVSGWDPSFNAITGLNGSGKSNLTDGICFVLGITNFSTLRAQNLQDLIYKQGKAGINKASVSIRFDNTDPESSPVGWEDAPTITVTRTVVMGGTSKYLINGHRATQKKAQDLFESCKLNINNPNFHIAQGKITKVLNMKPKEILALLEEAAGTSMFEDHRGKALKVFEKKDKKLDELAELIKIEVTPKIDKLRGDKRGFLEYQQIDAELEKIARLVTAFDWQTASERHDRCVQARAEQEEAVADTKQDVKRLQDEIGRMTTAIAEIKKRRDKDAKGGKISKLEEQLKELENQKATIEERIKSRSKQIKDDKGKIRDEHASAGELDETRELKARALADITARYDKLLATHDTLVSALQQSEELLQSVTTGITGATDSSSSGYMGQLAAAKARVAQLGAEVEQTRVRIAHMTRELKDKEPRARQAQSDGSGLTKELESAKSERARLQAELAKLDGGAGAQQDELTATREAALTAVRDLTRKRDGMQQSLGRLNFQYADPSPNFDRSKVYGLVASQVRLRPEHVSASGALEIAGGGRLYNVMVEDESVGKQLLERGRLQSRVTIIPLNKIAARRVSDDTVRAAKKLAPGKVHLALDMLTFEPKLAKAMEFVFGNVFICADSDTAKRVAFDRNVRVRCVTLDGDVYNPSGTLEGGSAPSSSRVLETMQQVQIVENDLAKQRKTLDAVEARYHQAKGEIERYTRAKKAFELKSHEVSLLEERMADSSATRIVTEVAALKESLTELNATATDVAEKRKGAEAECKRIEREMNELKNNRESKLEQIRAEIRTKKVEVTKSTKAKHTMTQDVGAAKGDVADAESAIEASKKTIAEAQASIASAEQELVDLKSEHDEARDAHERVDEALTAEQAQLSAYNAEIKSIEKTIDAKNAEIGTSEGRIKELENSMETANQDARNSKALVAKLQKENRWISDDKHSFGVAGGDFDFAANDMAELKRRKTDLEAKQKKAKKKVNDKVLNQIESIEKRERDVHSKMEKVRDDRRNISKTIAELDDKAAEKLKDVHEKVSEQFGIIFAELLPGNTCRLVRTNPDKLSDGLEVQVRLGQAWKKSLTELSGGQRSLIALSLIMALLRYSPAPMYILDEVDAALDLSHTQNIGRLFKTHFKGSQFIVVSLKEGLFSNANVLYRARFKDSTSVVERTASRSTNPMYQKRVASG